jgi:hypothetical protein
MEIGIDVVADGVSLLVSVLAVECGVRDVILSDRGECKSDLLSSGAESCDASSKEVTERRQGGSVKSAAEPATSGLASSKGRICNT